MCRPFRVRCCQDCFRRHSIDVKKLARKYKIHGDDLAQYPYFIE